MILTEQHIISKNDKNWKQCDALCFQSKNLYNYALFKIRKYFEENKKFLRYNDLEKILRVEEKHETFYNLPPNTSQQILMIIDKAYKGYFELIKKWKQNKNYLSGLPKPPKYKHKTKGRNLVIFTTNQAKLKENFIHFPKKTGLLPIKTKVKSFQQVRIIPQSNCYIVEIIYKKKIEDKKLNKENYISIDLGINNLCAITFNQSGITPLLINGRIIKSMNQYFNKKKAKIQGDLERNWHRKTSNKLNKLYEKRKNKINYYMHHVSKYIINQCIKNDVGNIIIGYNKEWKQKANLGKRNNQKFVMIPYFQLIQQIKYKAELNGITVIINEENYTSKCSALDLEKICKHDEYIGKREKRGLFKYSSGYINVDINGSLNIMRKVIGDDFIKSNRGLVVKPIKVIPL